MWSLVRLLTFLLLASPAVAQTDPYLASNGTFKIPFALANTWTAVQTFNVAPVFGVLPSVPLAQFQILQGNGSGVAAPVTFSAAIDAAVGSTRGSILERGASGWQIVVPGTTALPWVSNGTGADPGYQALTGAGVAAGTIANSNLANMAANTVKGSIAGGAPADLNAPFITGGTQGQVLTKNTSTAGDASWRDQCLNIEAFGGVGNNSTNTVTPLTNALAALTGTGGCIFFPPGKYTFSTSVSYSIPAGIFSVGIVGGGQDNTILTWPAASGGLTFNYAGIGSSVHLRDLSLTTGTTTGGTAVTLNLATSIANPGAGATSDLYRVTMRGDDGYRATDYWTTGLAIANVSGVQIDNLTVSGSSTQQGIGTSIVGLPGSSTYAVLLDIAKSNYFGLATGLVYGSFVQGVTVDQTNFTFVTNGISNGASLTGALVQLSVTDSQFNPGSVSGGTGISLNTVITGLQISNNFFVVGGPSQFGIALPQAAHYQINNNAIQGLGSSAAAGIDIGTTVSSAPGIIASNDIYGFGSSGFGIVLSATSNNVYVEGNTFTANTTNISNSGTSNVIRNNLGYNPVGISSPTVGASPFTYTAGASPETLYYRSSNTAFTSITLSGTIAIAALSGTATATLELGPGESMVITDASVTRVLVRSIH
jgi:hypothetical protein